MRRILVMFNLLIDRIINWIVGGFKKLDLKSSIILILFSVIVLLLLTRGCGKQDNIDINTYKQNIAALNDSIRSYRTKNGEIIYEKKALISKVGELGEYSKELEDEIKKLKDNPIVVVKYKTVIEHIPFGVPAYPNFDKLTWSEDSTYMLLPFAWEYDTTYSDGNFRKLRGDFTVRVEKSMVTTINQMNISQDLVGMSFTTGLTENKDGFIEIFITSNYPGFKPTNIEGVLIDPRESEVIKKYFPPKRWGVGIHGGYGVYMDPTNGNIGHGLQIGVGVSYDLIQWRRKK